jgi:hypothetical protein
MKKVSFLLLLLTVCGCIFAQEYVVKSVTGSVEYEVSPGNWKPVVVNGTFSPSTIINVKLNSSVAFIINGRLFTVPQMRKGSIESMEGSVIRITGRVVESLQNKEARGNVNISTAATRAKEGSSELEWDE